MKLLREYIQQILLEGPARKEFRDWFWKLEDPENYNRSARYSMGGTQHKDMWKNRLMNKKKKSREEAQAMVDEIFADKRKMKRKWNELVEKYGTRSFWEGPEMKYFHSLAYYDRGVSDTLKTGISDEHEVVDLSVEAFLETYKLSDNKDEMSTYGVYKGKSQAEWSQQDLGFLLKGRVTLATNQDAFVESRSKATKVDMERHKGSGLPKRTMPIDDRAFSLLFDASDIGVSGPGECILDNWSIEAIVYNPSTIGKNAVQGVAQKYGIPMLSKGQVFKS
jgi:hypothetical protein